MPLIIAPSLCLGDDAIGNAGRANLISTVFLVTGICTLLQTILGTRYQMLAILFVIQKGQYHVDQVESILMVMNGWKTGKFPG